MISLPSLNACLTWKGFSRTLKRMEDDGGSCTPIIHLYTKEEVENASDDNKSCLEQAVLMMEASKSSSMTQPDYSPTVTTY
ncbi:hypothetical protein YC2023_014748 [Brassica napus]